MTHSESSDMLSTIRLRVAMAVGTAGPVVVIGAAGDNVRGEPQLCCRAFLNYLRKKGYAKSKLRTWRSFVG